MKTAADEASHAADDARQDALAGWGRARENALAREDALVSSEAARNPGQALLRALDAADHAQPRGAAHNDALLAAFLACRERRTFVGDNAAFHSAVFSPDRRFVATTGERLHFTSYGQTWPADAWFAQVWDAATGRLLHTLLVPGLNFSSLQFSPDSRLLLATFEFCAVVRFQDGQECMYTDGAVRIWEAATGKEVRVLTGHTNRVVSAVFSPDGRRILTASWDGTARIWDLATGKELFGLPDPRFSVASAVFSKDGSRVLLESAKCKLGTSRKPHDGRKAPLRWIRPYEPTWPSRSSTGLGR